MIMTNLVTDNHLTKLQFLFPVMRTFEILDTVFLKYVM